MTSEQIKEFIHHIDKVITTRVENPDSLEDAEPIVEIAGYLFDAGAAAYEAGISQEDFLEYCRIAYEEAKFNVE
jgi:hypothetical protein